MRAQAVVVDRSSPIRAVRSDLLYRHRVRPRSPLTHAFTCGLIAACGPAASDDEPDSPGVTTPDCADLGEIDGEPLEPVAQVVFDPQCVDVVSSNHFDLPAAIEVNIAVEWPEAERQATIELRGRNGEGDVWLGDEGDTIQTWVIPGRYDVVARLDFAETIVQQDVDLTTTASLSIQAPTLARLRWSMTVDGAPIADTYANVALRYPGGRDWMGLGFPRSEARDTLVLPGSYELIFVRCPLIFDAPCELDPFRGDARRDPDSELPEIPLSGLVLERVDVVGDTSVTIDVRTFEVRGRVLVDGAPPVVDERGDRLAVNFWGPEPGIGGATSIEDDDGHFTMRAVPGRYEVHVGSLSGVVDVVEVVDQDLDIELELETVPVDADLALRSDDIDPSVLGQHLVLVRTDDVGRAHLGAEPGSTCSPPTTFGRLSPGTYQLAFLRNPSIAAPLPLFDVVVDGPTTVQATVPLSRVQLLHAGTFDEQPTVEIRLAGDPESLVREPGSDIRIVPSGMYDVFLQRGTHEGSVDLRDDAIVRVVHDRVALELDASFGVVEVDGRTLWLSREGEAAGWDGVTVDLGAYDVGYSWSTKGELDAPGVPRNSGARLGCINVRAS